MIIISCYIAYYNQS